MQKKFLRAATPAAWAETRAEWVDLFGREEYGLVPSGWSSTFTWERELERDGLHGRLGQITLQAGARSLRFPFALWLPEEAARPAPCVIQISCHDPVAHTGGMEQIDPARRDAFLAQMKRLMGSEERFEAVLADLSRPKAPNTLDITADLDKGYWPVRQLLAEGYAAAAFYASDLAPDDEDGWKTAGLYPLFYGGGPRPADGFGCLSAWAFGAQRVLGALRTCPELDPGRIAVAGHSRAGKAALWAAAQDERFATAFVNNSGCCGAALNAGKLGERVSSMCRMMPRWFCENFLQYGDMPVEEMPFDQDLLLASMAPRPVFVTSGSRDYWSDPEAEYRSAASAGAVYAALGAKPLACPQYPAPDTAWCEGDVGYALREGPHDMTAWDWAQFCRFETLHFGAGA